MTKKMLWDLFTHTGKIEYYIMYKNWDDLDGKTRPKI